MCELYRYIYLDGYLVYRDCFDHKKCSTQKGAQAHNIALFVCENEASNYCDYRNHMTAKYGGDGVDNITDYT